jgi:hypothetical protein
MHLPFASTTGIDRHGYGVCQYYGASYPLFAKEGGGQFCFTGDIYGGIYESGEVYNHHCHYGWIYLRKHFAISAGLLVVRFNHMSTAITPLPKRYERTILKAPRKSMGNIHQRVRDLRGERLRIVQYTPSGRRTRACFPLSGRDSV